MSRNTHTQLIAIFALITSGCTPALTGNNDINLKVKESIIGKNIDSVYSNWGSPNSFDELPSKNGRIYTWGNYRCKSIVTTDKSGTIVDYSARGDCSLSK